MVFQDGRNYTNRKPGCDHAPPRWRCHPERVLEEGSLYWSKITRRTLNVQRPTTLESTLGTTLHLDDPQSDS
jgi:hypothetical protein